ncbi:MAG: S-layer homology domain-containing protein [Syntrophomonadaceae bacterium]|jgi:alpha-tubulin suppressor-like RCC1 family protein|nr:S-layer homology domain-containing protein [Syntrophomonadaceae bacterium]
MKRKKYVRMKILSVILALVMCLTLISAAAVPAFAESAVPDGDGIVTVAENSNGFAADIRQILGAHIVGAGAYHTAVVKADGSLWIWGHDGFGKLGNGTAGGTTSPVQIMDDVTAVNTGFFHSGAIKTDGSLWTWGRNDLGQLGDGTTNEKASPVKVLDNVMIVSMKANHTAAIKTDGSLWTWGWNSAGELGDGTTVDKLSPVKIMEGVIAVSTGVSHTAALKEDGSLWVWGNNIIGTVGDGTMGDHKLTPVKIMDGVAAVSTGTNYTAAIKMDGSLWTWGWNGKGQLGDGTTVDRLSPVKIMDAVSATSAGAEYTAAIKTDGSLWAWGSNEYGQLGDGTTVDRLSPVKIMDDVAAVSAGGDHTAVIKTDGFLWTWGWNIYGMLGDGTTVDKLSPVEIMNINNAVNFDTDRWEFRNQQTEIDKRYYTNLFGEILGSKLYAGDKDKGTGGQCFGMAATTAAINAGMPDVSTFGAQYLKDVPLTARNTELKMLVPKYVWNDDILTVELGGEESITAADFIKYAYLVQSSESEVMQRINNVTGNGDNNNVRIRNYELLYDTIREFESGAGVPVVITMFSIEGKGAGHAVYVLGIESQSATEVKIAVNDSNFPNDKKYVYLYKTDGSYTGWSNPDYPEYDALAFSTPVNMVYGAFNSLNVSKEPSTSALIQTSASQFRYSDGMTEFMVNGYTVTGDLLLPIRVSEDNGSDAGQPLYSYWSTSSNTVEISDIGQDSEFSVSGDKGGVSAYVPAGAALSFTIEDVASNVNIDNVLDEEITVTHSFISDEGKYSTIMASGKADNEITSLFSEKNLTIHGLKDTTVTLTLDDKVYTSDMLSDNDITVEEIIQSSTRSSGGSSSGGGGGGGGGSSGSSASTSETQKSEQTPVIPETEPTFAAASVWNNPFTDVHEADWFYGDVKYVHENQLFAGTSATTFSPNISTTRGMIVTVLGRLYGVSAGTYSSSSFSDVQAGQYYAPYIEWAKETGIVSGVGDNRFAPDAQISRQDLTVIITNYANFAGKQFPVTLQYQTFADESGIAVYAKNAVQTLYSGGIVSGKPNNVFDPSGSATRAEVASMLHRFIEAAN